MTSTKLNPAVRVILALTLVLPRIIAVGSVVTRDYEIVAMSFCTLLIEKGIGLYLMVMMISGD
jgi:hypothetical protein